MIYISDTNNYSLMTSCSSTSFVGIKSFILPESCNPTEITPSSNSKDDHNNYYSEETSITTNIQTIYNLVNTTL